MHPEVLLTPVFRLPCELCLCVCSLSRPPPPQHKRAIPPSHIHLCISNAHIQIMRAMNKHTMNEFSWCRCWYENVCWNFVWLLAVLHVSKEPEIDTIIGTNCRWRRPNRRKHTHNLATIKWRFSTGARAQTEDEQNAHTTDQPGGWMPLCCVPDPRCTR